MQKTSEQYEQLTFLEPTFGAQDFPARRFKNNNDPMFTLTSQDRHGVLVSGLYTNDSKDFARGPLPEKSRCLKSSKHDAGVIIYNGQKCFIRKLTPLECWRLQAWDDESFFRAFFLDKDLAHKFNIAYQRHKNSPVRLMQWAYKHQKMSDSQLYKQSGNGVTVEVIHKIGKQFKEDKNGKIDAKNEKGICN